MMSFLQRLGKSLMLPVACLPVAGILIGIGYWISSYFPDSSVASFLQISGLAIIDFIPLLFAVGIAIGMSNDQNGTAALAGLVAWLVITQLLKPESVCRLSGQEADLAFSKIENVFTSILAGCIGAFSYNRFKDTHLSEYISFFSGKRCVAIVSAALACLAALVLMFVWPLLFHLLTALGTGILSLGAVGAGLYVFFNRLLIPLGLHHALNQVFWFDLAGINDLARFWDGTGELGVTGQYMSGFFPIMMFALPAVALAFYHTTPKERRPEIKGLLITAALSSCLTGVTEPMEFSFMFVAPALYLVYALLCGLTAGIVAALPMRAGFNFSAGLVDYLLSFKAAMALHPERLLAVGAVAAVVFYFVFRWIIVRFDLKTPGRDDQEDGLSKGKKVSATGDKYSGLAGRLMKALGGPENIVSFDHCVSRLRIEVKSDDAVSEDDIRQSGVRGLIRPADRLLQIVIGPEVQFLYDEMRKYLEAV